MERNSFSNKSKFKFDKTFREVLLYGERAITQGNSSLAFEICDYLQLYYSSTKLERHPYPPSEIGVLRGKALMHEQEYEKTIITCLEELVNFNDIDRDSASLRIVTRLHALIGNASLHLNYQDQALDYLQLSYNSRKDSFGFEDLETGISLCDLGDYYTSVKDFDAALGYLNQAHVVFETRQSVEAVRSYMSRARIYASQGMFREASLIYNRVFEKKSLYRDEHPILFIQLLEEAAGVYEATGDHVTSERIINDATDVKSDLVERISMSNMIIRDVRR
jgi:tetratricopeptide (TPR) repeat protein